MFVDDSDEYYYHDLIDDGNGNSDASSIVQLRFHRLERGEFQSNACPSGMIVTFLPLFR